MKIAIFTEGYTPGVSGVVTSVKASVEELQRRGHHVTVIAPAYPKHKDPAGSNIIRIRSVPLPGNKQNFRVATFVPGTSLLLANQLDVDVIHGHNGGPISMLGWEVARFKRIPYIFTYHTMLTQYSHYILGGRVIKPKAIEKIVKLFINNTDYIVSPTDKITQELLSYGVSKPVSTIPTGIDINHFKPQKSDFIHRKLNLNPDKKILLYIGRISKEKSIDTLIKAFALTVKKQSQADLVVMGDGPQLKSLQALAKHLHVDKRVHFTGFIDPHQTPLAYNDATAVLLSSTTETQGLVIPESMACGTPTIVIKDPAFTTIVKHRSTGLVAPANTPQSIAKQIIWALDNPQQFAAMSSKAIAAIKPYSLQATTSQLEQLYQQAIDNYSPTDLTSFIMAAPRQINKLNKAVYRRTTS